jgi:outer membrane protein assembly factor BamB
VRSSRVRSTLLLALGALVALGAPAGAAAVIDGPPPLAAGAPWPKFRGNGAQTGLATVPPQAGGHRWNVATGKGIFSSPIIGADGTTYLGSADDVFYAISPTGKIRWKKRTGEIIDSAGLLDAGGNVYIPSADGHLYKVRADTGKPVWSFAAESAGATGGFINWFEGNVGMTGDGTIIAPNDNFHTYALDPSTGAVRWAFKTPDQTWALPAVDGGRLFAANNFFFGGAQNTFALNAHDGSTAWSAHADGAVVASPMVTPDHQVVVGAFDGYVRAYDGTAGALRWKFGTRDHIYASTAREPDGTVVAASADGSVYGLDPATGALRWQYDTLDPIRSSPAVDTQGRVYVGTGDRRLLVLNGNGTFRWAVRLAKPPRGTLNSSPALGRDAIVIGDSNGDIHSVPYDWCLRDGRKLKECDARDRLPRSETAVLPVTPYGLVERSAPQAIDANAPLAVQLVVRRADRTRLAFIDPRSVHVATHPASRLRVAVSGDRHYLTIVPTSAFRARHGKVRLTVSGRYLEHASRVGLAFTGGKPAGTFRRTLTLKVRGGTTPARFPLAVPAKPGDRAGQWAMSRIALSLPDVLPSYNQIGFDRLQFLLGMVQPLSRTKAVAWLVGAKDGPKGTPVADPTAKYMVPFVASYDHGILNVTNTKTATLELNGFENKTLFWTINARLNAAGRTLTDPVMNLTVNCADIGFYGTALQQLGQCTKTRPMSIYGGALMKPLGPAKGRGAPAGVGTVHFAYAGDRLVANVTGSTLKPADHNLSILALDAKTGRPLGLDYSYGMARTTNADGTVKTVSVPLPAGERPANVRAYLTDDTYPAARATVPR